MTSFIVVAKEKAKRISYANEYCRTLNIDPFDITLIERDSTKQNTQSIGIEDVKTMQKKIFFKPIKSPTKTVLIEESHLLTTEAQNALLKVLEEPPANTIIMLLAETKDSLLPTIISRCKVITLEENQTKLNGKDCEAYEAFIHNLPSMTIGERLKHAERLAKDKEKGIEWVGKLLLVLREEMLYSVIPSEVEESHTTKLQSKHSGMGSLHYGRDDIPSYLSYINSFQSLHTLLRTTNTNPRMAIEDTLLSLIE